MGCLFILAGGWALLCSAISSDLRGMNAFLVFIMGWGPLVGLGIIAFFRHNSRYKRRMEFISLAGVSDNHRFFHWDGSSAIALNQSNQTITLASADAMKVYKFSDVRSWRINQETPGQVIPAMNNAGSVLTAGAANIGAASRAAANSGLFIQVKDIDYPEWRITMNKATQNRWFEILTQVLNEGGALE